jgi:alpha-1,6-mannosyltransferase
MLLARRSRTLGLVLLGLVMTVVYTLALLRFPLGVIYRCALENLDKLARPGASDGLLLRSYVCNSLPSDQLPVPEAQVGLAMAAGVIVLFGAYAAGGLLVRRAGSLTPLQRGLIVTLPLVFAALLLPVYPATSLDLYDYAFRGRMVAFYEANNFIRAPRDFQGDPLFWYTAWRRSVTAYGPLWEGMSWVTARLAGQAPGVAADPMQDLLRLLMAYKLLAALGFAGCSLAIWVALGHVAPQLRWFGVYLWLWNPLAVWETAGAGHNDALMAGLIVLAVAAFGQRRELRTALPLDRPAYGDRLKNGVAEGIQIAAGKAGRSGVGAPPTLARSIAPLLVLTIGGLIKYSALFFGPVTLTAGLRRLPGWRQRLTLLVCGGLACGAVVALAYAPFWAGWETFRNITDRGELVNASWLAVLQPLLMNWMSKAESQALANLIGLALLMVGVAWATWRAWSAPNDLAGHMLWLLLWFLFVANPWFQPWYLLWALALVAIQPWRAAMVRCVGLFCCTALLSYLAGSFLRPALGWEGNGAAWNAFASVVIYGPSLAVLAAAQAPRRLRALLYRR